MSHEAQAPQKIAEKEVPLIVHYHNQLAMFEKQRDDAKVQYHQLEGAIFACKQMIGQYEANMQKAADLLKEKVEGSLKPQENMGEIKDGETNEQAKKQVAQK